MAAKAKCQICGVNSWNVVIWEWPGYKVCRGCYQRIAEAVQKTHANDRTGLWWTQLENRLKAEVV